MLHGCHMDGFVVNAGSHVDGHGFVMKAGSHVDGFVVNSG